MSPAKDYQDAREQTVLRVHAHDAVSVYRAKRDRDKAREEVLACIPDAGARERLRQRFEDADAAMVNRDIEEMADTISQKLRGCRADRLTLTDHHAMLRAARAVLEIVNGGA